MKISVKKMPKILKNFQCLDEFLCHRVIGDYLDVLDSDKNRGLENQT